MTLLFVRYNLMAAVQTLIPNRIKALLIAMYAGLHNLSLHLPYYVTMAINSLKRE